MIGLAPPELTSDEIGKTLQAEARRVVHLAHQRERWLRVGHDVHPVPLDQKFSMMVPSWQSRITYTYSVDVRPVADVVLVQRAHEPKLEQQAASGLFEVWRHLSIQSSVPEALTRAEINAHQEPMLRLYEPQVVAFFPLSSRIRVQWEVTEPIPVQRPGRDQSGRRAHPLTFRTVVTGHFLAPWGDDRQDRYLITLEDMEKTG